MTRRAAQATTPEHRGGPPSPLPPELVRFIEALADAHADADYKARATATAREPPAS